ncbi:hypothetical protein KFL_015700010 [Klebsormidium nitens]|uniref:Integrase catalytic domain-containing protein n=1 Tax=Klebsormidium nitens TaxID=105231 RepID=A0A1Y1IS38_KLENI|nr:hypothetical protein KFL_015700010 [Klebsormidium nitens]|eukprot:GAQ93484.1 hypothetical protein KFL_015700010 [Klebsormidium nitens]
MDSHEKIHIEKLKGAENYQTWKVLIQLLLTEKGLRKTIDPESRSTEEMAARTPAVKAKEEEDQSKALAAIGLRVSPEFLGIITDSNGSARAAWQEFSRMFQSVTNARKMMLREKLASLRMEQGESAAKKQDSGEGRNGGNRNKGMKKSMVFACPPGSSLEDFWILDSGASAHLCCQKEMFSEMRELREGEAEEIHGVGDSVRVEGIGKVPLICKTEEGEMTEVILEEVKFAPQAQVNLAALSKFLNKGATLHSEKSEVCLRMEGEKFLEASSHEGVSVIRTVSRKPLAFAVNQGDKGRLWHRRFGHASCETLAKMAQDSLVEGLPSAAVLRKAGETLCEDCVFAKQTRKPFHPSNRQSENPLDLVHTDLCGPMHTKSAGGARYVVTFIDDYSRCGTVQLLKTKDQAKQALEAYVSCVETQLGRKVKKIQSDRGGEYWNSEVTEFCARKGIIHQKTNPYSSPENGVAERLNRTLLDKVRAMLSESGLDLKWWGEAVLTASYVRNRTATKTHGKTPLELFFGQKPSVKELRVFGCKAFVHTPIQKRKKLDPVAKTGVFLGYEPGTKGYRILLTSDEKTVTISRDVTFDETERKDPEGAEIWEEPLQSVSPEKVEPEGEMRAEAPETENPPEAEPESGTEKENGTGGSSGTEKNGEEGAEPEVTGKRVRKPSQRYSSKEWVTANLAKETAEPVEPKTLEEALSSPEAELWREALEEEFASLQENQTWELCDPPPGVKPIPCKWAFKLKKDENGNVDRFKARLVIKGFKQKKGVDYDEVFAPVSRHVTLRSLLAVAAAENLEVDQLDIKTAFLNGDLEEEIWMEQPELFETGEKQTACLLKKSLYGLKQAPRAWYLKLTSEMRKLGFEPSAADPALFTKADGNGKRTFVAVWVDDSLVVGEKLAVAEVKEALGKIFTVRDLGPVRYFLGMEVARDRVKRTVKLTQRRAALDLLSEHGMEATRARRVPLNPGEKILKQGEPLNVEKFPYSSLVGSLLYLANCTRPDLAQVTGSLARFMSCPTEDHWRLARNVLSYLAGTSNEGLTYGAESLEFVGFCDANHGGDPETRRSTTGYVFLLGGAAVSWASKLQPTVAYSTVEAEYMAAAYAAKEGLWIRKLAADLGVECKRMTILSDNQGALQLIKHPITSQRSKHIDISHHFVRERVIRGELHYDYCCTSKMPADFLTKALTSSKFELCKEMIGMQ